MSFFYPPLDAQTVKNLLIVRQLVAEHAGYFLESPYPQAVEADLTTLFKLTQRAPVLPVTAAAAQEIDVEAELRTLYTEMRAAKPAQNDPDQLGYFRVSTSLMEKLLTLQEKAKNIKTMGEHHTMVLDFLQEICSPTQVEEFIKRLKEATV